MVDVLNASTGRNNSTEVKLKEHAISGTFGAGFAIGLMSKDLTTAADLARHLGLAAPMSRVCEELWRNARARLGDATDHTAIYKYLQDLPADG